MTFLVCYECVKDVYRIFILYTIATLKNFRPEDPYKLKGLNNKRNFKQQTKYFIFTKEPSHNQQSQKKGCN